LLVGGQQQLYWEEGSKDWCNQGAARQAGAKRGYSLANRDQPMHLWWCAT